MEANTFALYRYETKKIVDLKLCKATLDTL